MKYFTKQWYRDCQSTTLSFSFMLRAEEEAGHYSEAYFADLYQRRMGEMSGERQRHQNLSPKSAYEAAVWSYQYNLKYIPSLLPREILRDVADVRVLGLGVVSPENHARILRYCEETQSSIQATSQAYGDYYRSIMDTLPEPALRLDWQHDEPIGKIGPEGSDYVIETDPDGAEACRFIFKNAEVLEDVETAEGLIWLYEELYLIDGRYEVHVLFRVQKRTDDDADLAQLTLIADEICG